MRVIKTITDFVQEIIKITKPINRLAITLFNGRGGEDRTPVDGVGDR